MNENIVVIMNVIPKRKKALCTITAHVTIPFHRKIKIPLKHPDKLPGSNNRSSKQNKYNPFPFTYGGLEFTLERG